VRFLDGETNRRLSTLYLYLTPGEAEELIFYLQQLVADSNDHHVHFEDNEYKHELTVTIYREDNIHTYDERSRKLILDDE